MLQLTHEADRCFASNEFLETFSLVKIEPAHILVSIDYFSQSWAIYDVLL